MSEISQTSPIQAITGAHLLEWGWSPGAHFGPALKEANLLMKEGIALEEIQAKIDRLQPPPKIGPRSSSAPLSEAIVAIHEDEKANLEACRRLMKDLLRNPRIKRGSLMPDACPAGPGITVGGAIEVHNAIIPAAHSADICCSMYCSLFESNREGVELLDLVVQSTRFGKGGRSEDDLVHHPVIDEDVWSNPFLSGLQHFARIHMSDQGDGNHFAYLGEVSFSPEQLHELALAEHGNLKLSIEPGKSYKALVTHHGSRGLGAKVHRRGETCAERHTNTAATGIPKHSHWIDYDTDEGKAYWDALQYLGRWTKANHESIHSRFLSSIEAEAQVNFWNAHNFVWKRGSSFFHGKGATPAWTSESGRPLVGLIPLNMAAPILLVAGADNDDYLSFAPHGAGRNISRSALLRRYPTAAAVAEALEESTHGLDARWFSGTPDLSETPLGYKSANQVARQIKSFGLARELGRIQPIGCVMAGHIEPHWKKAKKAKPS